MLELFAENLVELGLYKVSCIHGQQWEGWLYFSVALAAEHDFINTIFSGSVSQRVSLMFLLGSSIFLFVGKYLDFSLFNAAKCTAKCVLS